MFEMSPEQAALVVSIMGFFPLLFQYLTLVAAHPFPATIIAKIGGWIRPLVPWLTDDLSKRSIAWGLATLVMLLTGIPFFPALPQPITFSPEWFAFLFAWGTNLLLSLATFFLGLQFFFKYFWQNIFNGGLSTRRISKLTEENIKG